MTSQKGLEIGVEVGMWASLEDDLATDHFVVCIERSEELDVASIP